MNFLTGCAALASANPLRDAINTAARLFAHPAQANASAFIDGLRSVQSIHTWTREDTYWNVLGRLPEKPAYLGIYASEADRISHIWSCIVSDELRFRFPERILALFPERPRRLFLHIPRTGGTAVREHIESHLDVVTWSFNNEDLVNIDHFHHWNYHNLCYDDYIARLLTQLSDVHAMPLTMTGHASASDIFARNLISPRDECFTTTRLPFEIITSIIRYQLQSAFYNLHRADAQGWRMWIETLDPDWLPGKSASTSLLGRMVRSEQFSFGYRDPITRVFSREGDVQQALDYLQIFRFRVFDIADPVRIRDYVNDLYDIDAPFEMRNCTSPVDLDFCPMDSAYIEDNLISNDKIIYRTIHNQK